MSKPTNPLLEAATQILVRQGISEAKAVEIDEYKKNLRSAGIKYPHPEYIKKMHDFVQKFVPSLEVKEAVNPTNRSYGFLGTLHSSDKEKSEHVEKIAPHVRTALTKHLAKRQANDAALAKKVGGSSASKERAKMKVSDETVSHFLDSTHGRHIADAINTGKKHHENPGDLDNRAHHFLKDYHPDQFKESTDNGFDQGPELEEQTGDTHTQLSRLNRELLDIRQKDGIKKAVPGSRQHEIEQQIAKHKRSLGEDFVAEGMMGLESTSSHKQEADKHPVGSKLYYHHTGLHHEAMAKIASDEGNQSKAREHRGYAGKYKKVAAEMNEEVDLDESLGGPSDEWLKAHGMTRAQYNHHEYGKEKPLTLKIGARVNIVNGGHGKGTVQDLYKRKIATGATKQFMHVKYDNGKEEHHRVDSTNHKLIKEDIQEGFFTRNPTFSNAQKNLIIKITNRLETNIKGQKSMFQMWKHDDLHRMGKDHGLSDAQSDAAIAQAVKDTEAKRFGNTEIGFSYRKAQKMTEEVETISEGYTVHSSASDAKVSGPHKTKDAAETAAKERMKTAASSTMNGDDWKKLYYIREPELKPKIRREEFEELVESFATIESARNKKERLDEKHPTTAHSIVRGKQSGKYFVVRAHSGMEHVAEGVEWLEEEIGEEVTIVDLPEAASINSAPVSRASSLKRILGLREAAGVDGQSAELKVDGADKAGAKRKDKKPQQDDDHTLRNAITPAKTPGSTTSYAAGLGGFMGGATITAESFVELDEAMVRNLTPGEKEIYYARRKDARSKNQPPEDSATGRKAVMEDSSKTTVDTYQEARSKDKKKAAHLKLLIKKAHHD